MRKADAQRDQTAAEASQSAAKENHRLQTALMANVGVDCVKCESKAMQIREQQPKLDELENGIKEETRRRCGLEEELVNQMQALDKARKRSSLLESDARKQLDDSKERIGAKDRQLQQLTEQLSRQSDSEKQLLDRLARLGRRFGCIQKSVKTCENHLAQSLEENKTLQKQNDRVRKELCEEKIRHKCNKQLHEDTEKRKRQEEFLWREEMNQMQKLSAKLQEQNSQMQLEIQCNNQRISQLDTDATEVLQDRQKTEKQQRQELENLDQRCRHQESELQKYTIQETDMATEIGQLNEQLRSAKELAEENAELAQERLNQLTEAEGAMEKARVKEEKLHNLMKGLEQSKADKKAEVMRLRRLVAVDGVWKERTEAAEADRTELQGDMDRLTLCLRETELGQDEAQQGRVQLQEELYSVQKNLETSSKQLLERNQRIQQLQMAWTQEKEALEQERSILWTQYHNLQATSAETSFQKEEEFKRELANARVQHEALIAEADLLRRSLDGSQRRVLEQARELDRASQIERDRTEQLASRGVQLQQLETELSSRLMHMTGELETAVSNHVVSKEMVAELERRLVILATEKDILEEEVQRGRTAEVRSQMEVQSQRIHADQSAKETQEWRRQLADIRVELSTSQTETRTARQQVVQRQGELETSSGQLDKSKAELAARRTQLSRIQKQQQTSKIAFVELELRSRRENEQLTERLAEMARTAEREKEKRSGAHKKQAVELTEAHELLLERDREIARLRSNLETAQVVLGDLEREGRLKSALISRITAEELSPVLQNEEGRVIVETSLYDELSLSELLHRLSEKYNSDG